MSVAATRRAERCFALARSTTFGGEREAAIARGVAIVQAAGLSLDDFDIPGRAGAKRPARAPTFEEAYADPRYHHCGSFDWTAYQDELERYVASAGATKVARSNAPRFYDSASISELTAGLRAHGRGVGGALEELYATLARREAEVAAQPGESVYEARRRNFDEAVFRSVKDAIERAASYRDLGSLAADVALDFAFEGSGVAQAFLHGHWKGLTGRMAARHAELSASRARWPDEAALVDFLFSRGIPVYDLGEAADARWYVQKPEGATEVDEGQLRALADELEGAR